MIANKNDTWAFSIREYGPGNKVAGTVYFENFDVLRRFLSRTGAEAGGPKTVYVTGPADAKNETIQAILDACKAAGLHVLAPIFMGGLPGTAALPGDTNVRASNPAVLTE